MSTYNSTTWPHTWYTHTHIAFFPLDASGKWVRPWRWGPREFPLRTLLTSPTTPGKNTQCRSPVQEQQCRCDSGHMGYLGYWDTGKFVKHFCLESIYKNLVVSMHVRSFFLSMAAWPMESWVREMFHSFSSPFWKATAQELSELRPQSCCTSPWSQPHGSSFVGVLFLGTFPSEGFCCLGSNHSLRDRSIFPLGGYFQPP